MQHTATTSIFCGIVEMLRTDETAKCCCWQFKEMKKGRNKDCEMLLFIRPQWISFTSAWRGDDAAARLQTFLRACTNHGIRTSQQCSLTYNNTFLSLFTR